MEEDTKNDTHTVISSTVNKENTNKKKKFFLTKLRHGDYSLATTFWGFAFSVNFILHTLGKLNPIDVLPKIFGWPITIIMWSFWIIIGYYYQICLNIGTWRAANKYNGPKIWKIFAKIFVCIWWIRIVLSTMQLIMESMKYTNL